MIILEIKQRSPLQPDDGNKQNKDRLCIYNNLIMRFLRIQYISFNNVY
jgi:hypothetical protein